ncbi:MAG: chemotaxis protein CheR, partial [Candidatus Latescibacterota bacterium]
RMRWTGFRKVRRQVRKRLVRRLDDLELGTLAEYQIYLERHPGEWRVLDTLCRITISRFYRDRGVFDRLQTAILPNLAQTALRTGDAMVRCWSVGCASGEEPYTLSILWKLAIAPNLPSGVTLDVTATEANARLLERAKAAIYESSSIKELAPGLADAAFDQTTAGFALRDRFKRGVRLIEQDIRNSQPEGMFHLVLCRNLVFTYFDDTLQSDVLERITQRLVPGGYLIVGIHEAIPDGFPTLTPHAGVPGIYRKGGPSS